MNSNAKYFIAGLIIVIGVIGVSFYSCEKEEILPNETSPLSDPQELVSSEDNTVRTDHPSGLDLVAPENTCGQVEQQLLYIKDNVRVGGLNVYNDGKNLYFQFGFTSAYRLQRSYIHIAFDKAKIPVDKKGNLDPEAFKYQSMYSEDAKTHLIKIPLSDIKKSGCLIAFAVDITNSDDKPLMYRAWAGKVPFGEGVEGTIMKYTVEPCLVDDADSNDAVE